MDVVRTPDDRFEELADWPYEPRYADVGDGLRMHYVDEGPIDGPVVLLAHGEPTWGYLYRRMIGPLIDAGRRIVVPDLIGFGRSDKPTSRDDYTYANHVAWCGGFLDALDLDQVTLFGQDWGGLINLVHVGRQPDRFAGVVAANTALADPRVLDELSPEAVAEVAAPFLAWLEFSQRGEPLLASEVVGGDSPLNQTGHRLTPGEAAAYDAPFPDESYLAGARQFPLLVPLTADDPAAGLLADAWRGLETYDRPFLTAFAESEDITAFFEPLFQARVPGAQGRDHVTVTGAGHFLQEHNPAQCVEAILSLG